MGIFNRKEIFGLIVAFATVVYSVNTLVNIEASKIKKREQAINDNKKKCFDEFKSLEYEVVSDELYCKTLEGFVKADPKFNQ